MNSLPKTVTQQRCGCNLNPGLSAPESSTLTTRLPSHPRYWLLSIIIRLHFMDAFVAFVGILTFILIVALSGRLFVGTISCEWICGYMLTNQLLPRVLFVHRFSQLWFSVCSHEIICNHPFLPILFVYFYKISRLFLLSYVGIAQHVNDRLYLFICFTLVLC